MDSQAPVQGPDGKRHDVITVSLKDGTVREFYFEFSVFFGTF